MEFIRNNKFLLAMVTALVVFLVYGYYFMG